MAQNITELDLVNESKIIGLPQSVTAITAWRAMLVRNELTALPVVDAQGALILTISASDFRGIEISNFADILLPVGDFLAKSRGPAFTPANVTCKATDSLHDVLAKLLANKVHRVWIVNAAYLPIGVITLTDIIKKFSIYDPKS